METMTKIETKNTRILNNNKYNIDRYIRVINI
jgi:hypothetical protein